MSQDKIWMSKDRGTKEWQDGMKAFLDFAFQGAPSGATVPCPCTTCRNVCHKTRKEVHRDLLHKGILLDYTCWTHHGEKTVPENIVEQSNSEGATPDDAAIHNMLSSLITFY
jgi:hypothetical protein